MANIVITSEMRTGSRWLHYMLADMLSMETSPEMDTSRLFSDGAYRLIYFLEDAIIPKFHRSTYWDFETIFGDSKLNVVAVVRNPRDRCVSVAFHNRYHKISDTKQKEFSNDFEAVEFTALYDESFKKSNIRQLSLMIPGNFITNYKGLFTYVWIDYDILIKNTIYCLQQINHIFKFDVPETKIIDICEAHKFSSIAKREPGNEERDNLWHRKGIVGDWNNWYTDKMIKETQMEFDTYNKYLEIAIGY